MIGSARSILLKTFFSVGRYFTTGHDVTPSYTYSGEFGVPLEGLGVGLPFCREYCKFMNGYLDFVSVPNYGSQIIIGLDQTGVKEF